MASRFYWRFFLILTVTLLDLRSHIRGRQLLNPIHFLAPVVGPLPDHRENERKDRVDKLIQILDFFGNKMLLQLSEELIGLELVLNYHQITANISLVELEVENLTEV